jgi:hypothetical protein
MYMQMHNMLIRAIAPHDFYIQMHNMSVHADFNMLVHANAQHANVQRCEASTDPTPI